MASGWTNRGKKMVLDTYFRAAAAPTNFYLALCTSASTPTADTNTFADMTEIAAGNGYTAGGISVARNSTDFDTLTEDDTGDLAKIQLKDESWTASGGPLPSSGGGARWAILTDDNATQSARQIIYYWDLASDRSVSVGQTLTLADCEGRLTE